MIAAVLTAALAATPYADAFWTRDLGRLQAELMGPPAPHRALFMDLLAIATCRDPGPLTGEEDWALREALRVEWTRRPAAVVDDLRNPRFFSRAPHSALASGAHVLSWTVEEERWPDELDVPAPLPADCPLPHAGLIDPGNGFLDRVAKISPPLSARWRYWLSARRYAAGDLGKAAELAQSLDPELVGAPLRGWALGLRGLLLKPLSDPARVAELPEPLRAAVAERACRVAVERGDTDRALAFGASASSDALTMCRVAALARAGQVRRAAEAIASLQHPDRDWLSALALATGDAKLLANATDGLDDRKAAQWLADLGEAALDRRRMGLASSVIARLRNLSAELDADALETELQFRAGRIADTESRMGGLLDEDGERFRTALQRGERDRRMASLLRRLVLADAEGGATRRALLRDFNERFTFVASSGVRAQLDAVQALLEEAAPPGGVRRRALGVVVVPVWPPLPKLEQPKVRWPEPGPLFGIPTPEGGLRTWFNGEEVGSAS